MKLFELKEREQMGAVNKGSVRRFITATMWKLLQYDEQLLLKYSP
jgi:hypothetical protein